MAPVIAELAIFASSELSSARCPPSTSRIDGYSPSFRLPYTASRSHAEVMPGHQHPSRPSSRMILASDAQKLPYCGALSVA